MIYRTCSTIESMSLIHVINVVLLMNCLPILIFENLSEYSFGTCWLRSMIYNCVTSTTLNTHASSMNGIELVFDVVNRAGWSITSCSSTWIPLNWWSWYIKFGTLSWDQILSLITARLNQETLIYIRAWLNISYIYGTRVNGLPSIFLTRLTHLNHVIDILLISRSSTCLALTSFLRHKSHR